MHKRNVCFCLGNLYKFFLKKGKQGYCIHSVSLVVCFSSVKCRVFPFHMKGWEQWELLKLWSCGWLSCTPNFSVRLQRAALFSPTTVSEMLMIFIYLSIYLFCKNPQLIFLPSFLGSVLVFSEQP